MKHKGGTARDRLKEVWNEIATRRTPRGHPIAAQKSAEGVLGRLLAEGPNGPRKGVKERTSSTYVSRPLEHREAGPARRFLCRTG